MFMCALYTSLLKVLILTYALYFFLIEQSQKPRKILPLQAVPYKPNHHITVTCLGAFVVTRFQRYCE